MNEENSELNPCELGTKEYWDESYSTEIKNYEAHGDVGEVWFDESSQFRIIKWLKAANVDKNFSIIDLGKF
jgi:EEF1A lysine methyltransferase 2